MNAAALKRQVRRLATMFAFGHRVEIGEGLEALLTRDPSAPPVEVETGSFRDDVFTGLGVWVANEGACEKICMPLDGKVMSAFLDPEEVAHPNCQCAIEPIEAEPPAGTLERSPTR